MKKISAILFGGLFTIIALGFSNQAFAQDGAGAQAFVKDVFETRFNGLSKTHNSTSFLSAFRDNFTGNNVKVTLDGRIITTPLNKTVLDNMIKKLWKHSQLSVQWKITSINETFVKGETRAIGMNVTTAIYDGSEEVSKSTNAMNVLVKKSGDSYEIFYMTIMSVDEEMKKGRCFADLYARDTKMMAKVYYPDGTSYSENSVSFDIVGSEKIKTVIINNGEKSLFWNTVDGTISGKKDGSDKIAEGRGNENMAKAILMKRFSAQCTSMILTK